MNTTAVSQLLGVSSSTVQRWVKHLGLEMKRNEYGHYIYSEEDVECLREFQKELQKGVPIQSIAIKKKTRKGSVVVQKQAPPKAEKWMEKIRELESRLNNKADSVVAYQLMQHRGEIEELEQKISMLSEQLEELQDKYDEIAAAVEDYRNEQEKRRKKTFFRAIFNL